MSKFALYRFIAPFRSRLQARLRDDRLAVDEDEFVHQFEGGGGRSSEVARALWDLLRTEAFVSDFRPAPDDILPKIYAMGPEEVRDDVIEPILMRLGLKVDRMNFKGVDFASILTPRDVVTFITKVADAQQEADV